jgi:EAL domain-containing protein (putative c-di-GMP-specific phosphodiesterase class I)/CHASE2 domain-containing sensor protein
VAPLRLTWSLGALVAAAALGLLLLATGSGQGLDDALGAARAASRPHPASGTVHIVEIDGRSIREFKRWPWPRSIHAAAVDRLRAAGAASIAFDVDFSSPSEPSEDEALAQALSRAGGTVILPAFRRDGEARAAPEDVFPVSDFRDRAFIAAANVRPGADGVLRTMPSAVEIGGSPRPSLAAMLAEKGGEVGAPFLIDRSIDPAGIPRHSMADLIAGRIPAATLRGKRVVIGATAIELGDRYAMPDRGLIPGVVVQALAAETLLGGHILHPVGGGWALALVLALAAATLRPGHPGRSAVLLAGAGSLVALLPLAADRFLYVDLPIAPAIAALVAACAAGTAVYANRRYRNAVLADSSTGLPNLAALAREAGGPAQLTLAVARVDAFADLMSAIGPTHAAELLTSLAARLRIGCGANVYRVGEATLAWIEHADDRDERFAALGALLRPPFGSVREVVVNFGVANGPPGEIRRLCVEAGLAAGYAAASGQRWQIFTVGDAEAVTHRLALLADLAPALAGGQIFNAYQPKLDLRSGRISGVEALVRWNHPERGPIAPASFIPLLEAHGRAAELTRHVMTAALKDAAAWAGAGCPISVAVNLSAPLLVDAAFMAELQTMVRESQVGPARVTIEITESAAMADADAAAAMLAGWRSLGVGVSIDDYGTGQSSLSYLQRLPATELKIDRRFVAAIAADARDAILVRSTLAVAHELGLAVVAEGVEDEMCLAHLRALGCDQAQGWHIGRPLTADSVVDFVRKNDRSPLQRAG